MKQSLVIAMLGWFWVAGEAAKASPTDREWYLGGGNLRLQKIADWKVAPFRKRLAATAEMVINVYPKAKIRNATFKLFCMELEACISEVATIPSVQREPVGAIAAACLILMQEEGKHP